MNSKRNYSYLYLLHAGAWGPKNGQQLGTVSVKYSDGTSQKFPVIRARDIGDTWNPVLSYANAKVGLRLEKKKSACGLYVSAFHLDRKKRVASIDFNVDKYVWGIAGISLGNWPLPESVEPPYIASRGDQVELPKE